DQGLGADGPADVEAWWRSVKSGATRTPSAEQTLSSYGRTFEKMRAAEQALQPWVIRHLKPREFAGRPRRLRLPGAAILLDQPSAGDVGLEVSGPALLPFLLAARATVCAPASRPVFAEGLASSYEAFLHTRQAGGRGTDHDDDPPISDEEGGARGRWYLDQLERALPLHDHQAAATHPKVSATARRVLSAWRHGEQVVAFCHYVATGRVRRQVISALMSAESARLGADELGCAPRPP